MEPVQRVSRHYFEAEFGPIDSPEHTAEIGPRVETTPAFMVPGLVPDDRGEG